MNLSFQMLWLLTSLVPAEPQSSNRSGLEDEGSGIKGKQSYFDCTVPPTVGETDGTGAAARDGRRLLLPSVTKIFI